MDSLLGIFFITGSILMLLGSLMIIIQAFKTNFWWGLGVLLVPFVGLAYMIMYWQESRTGAYVLIVGVLLSAVSFYGGAEEELELEKQLDKAGVDVEQIPVNPQVVEILEKRPGKAEVPNQAKAEAMGIDTQKDIYEIEAEREEAPLVIPQMEQAQQAAPEPVAVPMSYQPVSRKRLPEYLGRKARVHTNDGRVHEGRLSEVSEKTESVYLLQRVGSGEASFEYPFLKIEWIEVYAEVGKVPVPEEEQPAADEVSPRFLPEGQVPDLPEPTALEEAPPADQDSTEPEAQQPQQE